MVGTFFYYFFLNHISTERNEKLKLPRSVKILIRIVKLVNKMLTVEVTANVNSSKATTND